VDEGPAFLRPGDQRAKSDRPPAFRFFFCRDGTETREVALTTGPPAPESRCSLGNCRILLLENGQSGLCSRSKLAVWSTLPFLALSAGGLTVDTPSPDALCPPLEQTRSIVDSRLGSIELEGTWRAIYVLVHRERGDVVTLKLHDPSGRVRLEREFAAKDGTCATLAQVIALVLERYFLHPEANVELSTPDAVASNDHDSRPERAVDTPPGPSNTDVAAAQPGAEVVPTGVPEFGRGRSKPQFTLDTSLWVSTAWVAPGLGVGLRMNELWELGLKGGFDLSTHALPIANGWGTSRRIPLALQAKRQLAPGAPLRLYLGAELLCLYEHVHTEGLLEDSSKSRVVPGVGLRLGAEPLLAGSKLFPFVELSSSLLLRGFSSAFEVDHRPVFTLPTFVFGLDFGIRTTL